MGFSVWHKTVQRRGEFTNLTSLQLVELYHDNFGYVPGSETVAAFGAMAALCAAIEAAGTLEKSAVAKKLRELKLHEFYATFEFTDNGMIKTEPLTLQMLGNASAHVTRHGGSVVAASATVVHPPQEALGEMQFPMPPWAVRRCYKTCVDPIASCHLVSGECVCPPGYEMETGRMSCVSKGNNHVTVILVASGAAALLVLVVAIVAHVRRDRGRSRVLLRCTRQPPILTLRPGQSYHLFLSHT